MRLLKNAYPNDKIIFRVVTLLEPAKAEMVPFLEAEHAGKPGVSTSERSAFIQFYRGSSKNFYQVHLELRTGKVNAEKKLEGKHSYVDTDEMQATEDACIAAPEVQEAIRMLQLPDEAEVCIEPWTYGTDGMNDMAERIIMVLAAFQLCL